MPEDLLSRKPFANLVAEAILASKSEHSSVFALCGGWGTGKSWTAERIVEAVGDRMTVLRFEPWMVSSSESLTREFFLDLARGALGKENDIGSVAKRERFWRYAAQVMEVTGAISSPLGILGVPGASLASEVSRKFKDPIKAAAEALKILSEKPSLREARDSLVEELRDLNEMILMVIDDVDRLSDDEIRTLFRLLKACADFPNIKYLLIYDRPQVVNALGSAFGSGEEFLDKIVGCTFDLPIITSYQSFEYLQQSLAHSLPGTFEEHWDERLNQSISEVLLPGLGTLRLIDAFVKTASALLSGLLTDSGLEVDLSDFLLLEFVRQRFPELYVVLQSWDRPLVGGPIRLLTSFDEVEKERTELLKKSLDASKADVRLAEAALQLLSGSTNPFSSDVFRSERDSDHLSKRFRSGHWRPVYFGFHSGRSSLSEEDFSQLREALYDAAQLQQWLDRLKDVTRRFRTCDMLCLRLNEFEPEQLESLLESAFTWGESQTYDVSSEMIGGLSWPVVTAKLGSSILSVYSSNGNSVEMFRRACLNSRSLLAPSSIIASERSKISAQVGTISWASADDILALASALSEELRKVIHSQSFWQLPDIFDTYLLYSRLGNPSKANEWYEEIWENEDLLCMWVDRVFPSVYKNRRESFIGSPEPQNRLEKLRNLPSALLTAEANIARKNYLIWCSEWQRRNRLRNVPEFG